MRVELVSELASLLLNVRVLGFESAFPKPILPRVGNVFSGKLDRPPLRTTIGSVHVVAMAIGRYAAADQVKRVDDLVALKLVVKMYRSRRLQSKPDGWSFGSCRRLHDDRFHSFGLAPGCPLSDQLIRSQLDRFPLWTLVPNVDVIAMTF